MISKLHHTANVDSKYILSGRLTDKGVDVVHTLDDKFLTL